MRRQWVTEMRANDDNAVKIWANDDGLGARQHGKNKDWCKDCGGRRLCQHQRQKHQVSNGGARMERQRNTGIVAVLRGEDVV